MANEVAASPQDKARYRGTHRFGKQTASIGGGKAEFKHEFIKPKDPYDGDPSNEPGYLPPAEKWIIDEGSGGGANLVEGADGDVLPRGALDPEMFMNGGVIHDVSPPGDDEIKRVTVEYRKHCRSVVSRTYECLYLWRARRFVDSHARCVQVSICACAACGKATALKGHFVQDLITWA